jgi:GH25 family lysozyme M1 (1,4-beta-N-acetylmuramidase)
MFLNHIKGASTAGLKVGVYFFTEAINYAEGREEAEFTLKLIEKAGVNLYYPIAVDTEYIGEDDEGIIPRADNISKSARTDAIKGFCDVIKERGGQPMIYASLNWFDTHLDISKLPFDVWVAQYYTECQYKGKYLMWQYTSKGRVEGVKEVVDMNKCYITSPAPQPKPQPTPPTPSGGYTGSFPTEDEIKAASNQGVINRSVAWAKDIAKQGFDYLMPQSAGCYFCGTTKKKAYTCMPFVTAMFAHGGGDADVLSLCKNKHSFSLRNEDSDWQMLIRKGKFAYLGRMSGIDWSAIKVGDVLVQYASDDRHGHMMLYAGNNELAEASPDIGCAITSGAKSRYARYARGESQCGEGAKNFVMRYVGTRSYMSKGDSGTAVLEWQDFLDWWSDGAFYKECGKGDGVFGANTHKWTVDFQEKEMGKGQSDGTVGMKTISVAKSIRK